MSDDDIPEAEDEQMAQEEGAEWKQWREGDVVVVPAADGQPSTMIRLDAKTEKGFRGTALTDYRVDIREVNDARGDSYVVETLKQGKLTGKQSWRSIRKYGKEEASKWAAEEKRRREEAIEKAAQCWVSDEKRSDCTTYSLRQARKCRAAELQFHKARANPRSEGVSAGIREVKQRQRDIENVANTGQTEGKPKEKSAAKATTQAKAKGSRGEKAANAANHTE